MHKLAALFGLIRKDLAILWFALRHPDRPVWLLPAVAALALYVVSPIDLIPEALPVIGIIDDLVLIPLVVSWIVGRLPPHLRVDRPD
ncbi:MAG: DUF1232 domain-containing protein [Rhodocyclaceae bacterium]|nr:DUF1232 domain-containing protein [Rhodocyclaceae bacterium]